MFIGLDCYFCINRHDRNSANLKVSSKIKIKYLKIIHIFSKNRRSEKYIDM